MAADFLDTNVLVYLTSGDPLKAGRVERLLEKECVVSVQVLNEIVNVARRKMRLDWREIHNWLALVRELTTVMPMSIDTHEAGIRLAERYRLSTYDGMIVGAALLAGCETVWSEDMQDGLRLNEQLTIRNPFT
jgi:predicted nucleic acid-binding protein